MTKAIHLTLAQVKKAGLLAYHEKRLSAQGPTPFCTYRDASGRPCVIGAALSDKAAKVFDALISSSVGTLITRGKLTTDNEDALIAIQGAHDRWAEEVREGNVEQAAANEAKFLALLEGREP